MEGVKEVKPVDNETAFTGHWGKMLARYGGGITEAELDAQQKRDREARRGRR